MTASLVTRLRRGAASIVPLTILRCDGAPPAFRRVRASGRSSCTSRWGLPRLPAGSGSSPARSGHGHRGRALAPRTSIERRHRRDPLIDLLDNAPSDDEPITSEEEEGVRQARSEYRRGEVLAAEEIRREIA